MEAIQYKSLNARIAPKQSTEIHRRRQILNMTWDMQVGYIRGEGYQATYFDCADPKIWSECKTSAEEAAFELDRMVDRLFGMKGDHYVKIGNRTPVPITGIAEAIMFADRFDGILMTPIHSI